MRLLFEPNMIRNFSSGDLSIQQFDFQFYMLQNKQIEFLDGSIGSYIRSLSDAPKNDVLWGSELVVSDPDLVKRVHREYVDAGSTLITTCTYQASIQGTDKSVFVSRAR